MSDRIKILENEIAIYRDGKLQSVTTLQEDEKLFFARLKVVFPNSDIQILHGILGNVPKELK